MANCLTILVTAAIVLGLISLVMLIHMKINDKNGVWCPCGRVPSSRKALNQYPFGIGGNDMYWYECRCGRIGEKMISEERAANAWKVKYCNKREE